MPASPDRPRGPQPRAGRARLFLIPVLALLLGALSLFWAAPAQAQIADWTATLTVKPLGVGAGCSLETGKMCTDTSVLTDGDFTIGGMEYALRELKLSPSGSFKVLNFELNKSARPLADIGLTLHVGSTQFPLSANRLTPSETSFRWDTTTLSWAENDMVSLSLQRAPSHAAPTNLQVSPGVGRLDVSWRPPPASLGTVGAYEVQYTSSATVSNADVASGSQTDPAAGWIIALSSADASTTPSYTIAGLAAGTAYRVRVAYVLADLTFSGFAHATGTPTAPDTIALSATPTVDEGSSVTVGVTLAQAPTADVDVPLTLTAGTAETGDYDDSLSSITVSAGQTTGTGTITTTVDTDPDDETFTVAIDRTELSALGYPPGPGDESAKLIQIRDRSELSLAINYGDQKLLVGPNGDLGDPTHTYKRYVQASPTMERLSLTLSWKAGHIASDPTAQVYYYLTGLAGATLTWDDDTENGASKTLELHSNGVPGFPRVTLSAGEGVEYTIIFQNNGRWEFHHNNLLARLEMIFGR